MALHLGEGVYRLAGAGLHVRRLRLQLREPLLLLLRGYVRYRIISCIICVM